MPYSVGVKMAEDIGLGKAVIDNIDLKSLELVEDENFQILTSKIKNELKPL